MGAMCGSASAYATGRAGRAFPRAHSAGGNFAPRAPNRASAGDAQRPGVCAGVTICGLLNAWNNENALEGACGGDRPTTESPQNASPINAQTLPAGLPALTMEHARRFERNSRDASRVGFFTKLVRFAFAPVEFMSNVIDGQTRRIRGQVVWFNGLRASIEDGAKLLKSEGVTVAVKLDKMADLQTSISTTHMTLAEIQLSVAKPSPQSRINLSLHGLVAALLEVFNAVEGARWAVMEREADHDIAAGRVSLSFADADDAIAFLRMSAYLGWPSI